MNVDVTGRQRGRQKREMRRKYEQAVSRRNCTLFTSVIITLFTKNDLKVFGFFESVKIMCLTK